MTFTRIEDFNPNYRDSYEGRDLRGMAVCSDLTAGMLTDDTKERLGTVTDVLVDQAGSIQYFVVDLGAAMTGRKVLLPAEQARIDYKTNQIYAAAMTKEEAEKLPPFTDNLMAGRTVH